MLARANPGTTIAGGFAQMIMLLFGTCLITQRPARFGSRVRRSRTNLSRSLLPLHEGPAVWRIASLLRRRARRRGALSGRPTRSDV